MVEIRYGNQYETADLAGLTVSEAREQFRADFGIPDKAGATLNGKKVRGGMELYTVLDDEDRLSFTVTRHARAYMVGALLLAMGVTGGVFAAGFMSASATLGASIGNYDFADVSVNATGVSSLTWSGYGFFKGGISTGVNGTAIFNINTQNSGYTGDLTVSIILANTDQLAKVYRALVLKIGMCYPDGSPMDINESGTADADDWVMLTLENSAVFMYPTGTANTTTVRVTGGYYITNINPIGGWQGSASPQLFCELAQR